MRLLKMFVGIILSVFLLILSLWYFGIPEEYIEKEIEKFFKGKFNNTYIEIIDLKKTFFFGLDIKKLILISENKTLINIHNIHININHPWTLLIKRIQFLFNGMLDRNSGFIKGEIFIKRKDYKVYFEIKELHLEKLPLFQEIGIKGKSVAIIKGFFIGNTQSLPQATLLLNIKEMKFNDIISQDFYIPLSFFHSVRGTVKSYGKTLEIKSLSLIGNNIYSRLKGQLNETIFIGKLEIMPEPNFPNMLLYSLQKYKITNGYYIVPIKINYHNIF